MFANLHGFESPWDAPIKALPHQKMRKLTDTEKEARLLVAVWQGRTDEITRIANSGKPGPRPNLESMGRPADQMTNIRRNGKAGRGKTRMAVSKFGKTDLYRWGTPMHKAAFNGNADLVKMYIEELPPPKPSEGHRLLFEKTESGNTPLHHAAFRGHVHICELLLESMCDGGEVDVNRQLQYDPIKVWKTINSSIAAIHSRNLYLSTPLDKAKEAHQVAVVKLLEGWEKNLDERNKKTDRLNKLIKDHESNPRSLNTTMMHGILREVSRMNRPCVKSELVEKARALMHRAEDLQALAI